MRLIMQRLNEDHSATIGTLIVPVEDDNDDTERKEYWTCEDAGREVKVAGKTRIDAGLYQIRLRTEGGMVKRYDERYAPWHKGMLHLQNVPRFQYIYLHIGNRAEDSEGCILTGMGRSGMTILKSRIAYTEIYQYCYEPALNGELEILILDI